MLITVKIGEVYSVPWQTSKMNLLAKVIIDHKGEFIPCQTSETGLFSQDVID